MVQDDTKRLEKWLKRRYGNKKVLNLEEKNRGGGTKMFRVKLSKKNGAKYT